MQKSKDIAQCDSPVPNSKCHYQEKHCMCVWDDQAVEILVKTLDTGLVYVGSVTSEVKFCAVYFSRPPNNTQSLDQVCSHSDSTALIWEHTGVFCEWLWEKHWAQDSNLARIPECTVGLRMWNWRKVSAALSLSQYYLTSKEVVRTRTGLLGRENLSKLDKDVLRITNSLMK